MKKALGIDVGGTKLAYAIVDKNGNLLTTIEKTNTPNNINELKQTFKTVISKFEKEVDCVGFATAGAVNIENTKVESSSPNMPEGYTTMEFSELTSLPVYVENDANAASFAEFKIGASKNTKNSILVTLGTGIGFGIIVEGKLLRGKSGRAGEGGSLKLSVEKERQCSCGRYGCFEAYASGKGLKKTVFETFKKNNEKIFGKSPEDITTYDLFEGLKQKNKLCMQIYDEWHKYLSVGLLNFHNIFDTEMFVISGGLGKMADIKRIENYINNETVVSPVKVEYGIMDNNSGIVGAGLLALEKFS